MQGVLCYVRKDRLARIASWSLLHKPRAEMRPPRYSV